MAAASPDVAQQASEQHILLDPGVVSALLRHGDDEVRRAAEVVGLVATLWPDACALILRGPQEIEDLSGIEMAIAKLYSKQVEECPHGLSCFKLTCTKQHPPRWYTDRCEATCLHSDCPKVHGKRPAPCFDGLACRRAGCLFMHPQVNRSSSATIQLALGNAVLQEVVRTGLREICRVAAQHDVSVRLNQAERALVLEGDRLEQALFDVESFVASIAFRAEGAMEVQEERSLSPELALRIKALLRSLQRDLGISVTLNELELEHTLVARGPAKYMERAMQQLDFVLTSPEEMERELEREREDAVDIFVDNSNLMISPRRRPDGSIDMSVRLNIKALADLLRGPRTARSKVVVGSKPPSTAAVWQHWARPPPQGAGFKVSVIQRDADSHRESGVDESLVAAALMSVTDRHLRGQPPGVLVLGTGDGNDNGQRPGTIAASFINLVRHTLGFRWRVEVWCWRNSCNQVYIQMAEDPQYEGRLKVVFLDAFRSMVTFNAKALTDDDMCVFCMEAYATHAFKPCDHRVLCREHAELFSGRSLPLMGNCLHCQQPWSSIEVSRAGRG